MQAILSADQNWGIGKDGGLLVRVSEDMKFFRETTRGHAVVMGRKTFESLPGALPGRRNIVLSRGGFCAPGAEVAADLPELFALLGEQKEEAFVIGGGEIYRLLLPYTDRIFVTRWDKIFDADTFSRIWMRLRSFSWQSKARGSKAMDWASLSVSIREKDNRKKCKENKKERIALLFILPCQP